MDKKAFVNHTTVSCTAEEAFDEFCKAQAQKSEDIKHEINLNIAELKKSMQNTTSYAASYMYEEMKLLEKKKQLIDKFSNVWKEKCKKISK